MKKNILIFVLFFLSKAYAYEAVVIVFIAPLLKEARMNAIVLQTLRHGSKVYVPNEIGNQEVLPEFIQTYDRVGNIAYIPSKYIKIITNEISEAKMPIKYPERDPTDYRIEEPIPSTYPYDNANFSRFSFGLTSGSSLTTPYNYNSNYIDQNNSAETGGRFSVTNKTDIDKFGRFYLGVFGVMTISSNSIQFSNDNQANESRTITRAGPMITFDAYKSSKFLLTLGSGVSANYHKTSLKMTSASESEERIFTGYSLSPIISSYIQFLDIFPLVDLIGGADISFYLPFSQKTSDQVSSTDLWGEDYADQLSGGLKPQISMFIGLQVKY